MCTNPRSILSAKSRKDNVKTLPVPCGSCPECKKATLSGWLFRFEVELKNARNPLFVTLTYNDDNAVYNGNGQYCTLSRNTSGHRTLWPKDLQDWMKKLRFHHGKTSKIPLKFYAVGEYGTRTKRPHYHLILLNLENPKLVQDTWQKGFDYTLPLMEGGIQYVLKYITKPKIKIPNTLPMFSRMSKGLGNPILPKRDKIFTFRVLNLHIIAYLVEVRFPYLSILRKNCTPPNREWLIQLISKCVPSNAKLRRYRHYLTKNG